MDLERFVTAQATTYESALAELRAGRKRTHWMWFVFPQRRGLGRSETAHFYGIESREEALAYLGHPVLGARLRECTRAVLAVPDRSAHDIFGSPDDLKLCSCLSLFAEVSQGSPDQALFEQALARFCAGGSK